VTENVAGRARGAGCLAVALVALVLTGALFVTWWFVLAAEHGDITGQYDVYRYYGPLTFFIDFSISSGVFPLWNPLTFCGMPNAGNPQAFLFYPPNLLRSLALLGAPTPWGTQASLVVLIALHLLVAGVFTWALARSHGVTFPGALAAALVFMFSALMVRRAAEYHFIFTLAWTPVILLCIKNLLDHERLRDKLLFMCCGALLVGLAVLGGFLQVVSYLGVTCLFYALVYRLLRPRHPALPHPARSVIADVCCFGGIFFLAGLISSVLLLHTAELALFTVRQPGTQTPMFSNLMEWTFERFYQSIVVYPGIKYEAETVRGAGLIALMLAVVGLAHLNRRLVLTFGVSLYVLFDCGFGPPFPVASLVNLLTPFSQSAYSRSWDFAMLPLAMLAGLGVDTLTRRTHRGARLALLTLLLLYAAAATLPALKLWGLEGEHFLTGITRNVLHVPVLALIVMLVVLWVPMPRPHRHAVGLVLAVLLFAETWAWNREYVPWLANKRITDNTDYAALDMAFPQDNRRRTEHIASRNLYRLEPVFNGLEPLHLGQVRDFISGQPRDRHPFRGVQDWEPTAENHRGNLLLKRFFWLSREYVDAEPRGKQELFPAATTTFLRPPVSLGIPVAAPGQVPQSSMSEANERIEVQGVERVVGQAVRGTEQRFSVQFTLPAAVPGRPAGSAGAVHSTLVVHYTTTLAVQLDTQFVDAGGKMHWGMRHRPRPAGAEEQIIEMPIPDLPTGTANLLVKPTAGAGHFEFRDIYILSDLNDEDGYIRITEFTPNHVQLDVGPLEEPRILSFLDADFPGWTATVNGEKVEILQAFDLFKAVVLPPGTHQVRFEYMPTFLHAGLGISLGSTGAVLLAMLILLWLRGAEARRAAPPAPQAQLPEDSEVMALPTPEEVLELPAPDERREDPPRAP